MRIQRRLSEIYTICFLTFKILCNYKLFSFFSRVHKKTLFNAEDFNRPWNRNIWNVAGRLYSRSFFVDNPVSTIKNYFLGEALTSFMKSEKVKTPKMETVFIHSLFFSYIFIILNILFTFKIQSFKDAFFLIVNILLL